MFRSSDIRHSANVAAFAQCRSSRSALDLNIAITLSSPIRPRQLSHLFPYLIHLGNNIGANVPTFFTRTKQRKPQTPNQGTRHRPIPQRITHATETSLV
jgi:hypothetical protein